MDQEQQQQQMPQPTPEMQPGPGNQISPEVLSALGLTAEDVEKNSHTALENQKALEVAEKTGSDFYKKLKAAPDDDHSRLTINLVPLEPLREAGFNTQQDTETQYLYTNQDDGNFRGDPSMFPKVFMNALRRTTESYGLVKANQATTLEQRGGQFLNGYGHAALEANDWKTALETTDALNPGKAMEDSALIEKLREIATNDKRTGVEIAKLLQAKMAASQTPPSSDSGLRPAPPIQP